MAVVVQPAGPHDVLSLESIENSADALLIDSLHPDAWEPAPSGEARASLPGFVLVASDASDADAFGFVHVIEIAGIAHLEQLSVLPQYGRRGVGRALVEAAQAESKRRGYSELTLRTFGHVPWNAPFYSTCGFVESEPATSFHRDLVHIESDIGLDRYGRRIQMAVRLA